MMRKTYEDLTPEHRAKIDAIRVRRATPEARAEQERVINQVEAEIPPAKASPSLLEALARLAAERKRRQLSLADVAASSRIDRGMLSRLETGKIPNPTVGTLTRYAEAIGMGLQFKLRRKSAGRITRRRRSKV